MIATEKHYAFRGRLMSLLVLRYSGISSRPHLPQESPCFSSASLSLLTTDCGGNSNIKTSYNFTSPGESRAVTPRKCKPIFFVRCNAVEVPLSCGKHPPGSIQDGGNNTRIGKSTCTYFAVYRCCVRTNSLGIEPSFNGCCQSVALFSSQT